MGKHIGHTEDCKNPKCRGKCEERSPVECGVRCVGIDNKQHTCDPTKDVTNCGIVIRRKKLRLDDHKLYSCYECTY